MIIIFRSAEKRVVNGNNKTDRCCTGSARPRAGTFAVEPRRPHCGCCIRRAGFGGPLHILHEISVVHMPLQLICAHVHHGFRPEESDAEAEEVRHMAWKLEVPFEMIRVDVPAYMRENGKGPQEAARELRYTFCMIRLQSGRHSKLRWLIMGMIRLKLFFCTCCVVVARRVWQVCG